MFNMEIDALLTLTTIVVCFSMLIFSRLAADGVLLSGVVFLMLFGVLSVDDALAGFANEGVATVAMLYVVAYALSATGVVSWMSQSILGRPKTIRAAQLRLMLPVALFSSVLNNTPVVAMMVPAVSDWARRMKIPASQLMMPLSFAAIIGGVCTLIGTSTNLVINGMLIELELEQELALFDLAWVGIPCVIAVIGFILLTSKWLLPYKQGAAARFEDARQYTVEMLVETGSPLAGKSIEQAGLRHLSGLYLAEIIRGGDVIRVSPTRSLREEDRLIFVGNVDSVVDLKQIRGLVSAEQQVFKLDDKSIDRSLIEVVISRDFPLLRKTVKESEFRKFYGAVIIAVSRNGEQIKQRIGDLMLEPGDTLLLEANTEFVEKQRFAKDFLVVSPVADFQPVESKKQWVALGILVGMIATATLGLFSMFEAAVVATGALIATGCVSVQAARKKISWHIIVIIAASLALGTAMTNSGLADEIASRLIGTVSSSPELTLLAMFVLTAVFSAVISNVAAAVILFPIAVSAAESMGLNVLPFAVMIMVAASASFATPIGYQTNLMVYGPGDYQFSDFLKLGVPLTIIVGIVSYIVVPTIWPL
jgi:di/tricarboxylate transporter